MNEKRLLFAAAFSTVFLVLYAQVVFKPSSINGSSQMQNLKNSQQDAVPNPSGANQIQADLNTQQIRNENAVTIESKTVLLEIGESSGEIRRVTLKEFPEAKDGRPLQIGGMYPILAIRPGGQPGEWRLVHIEQQLVEFDGIGNGNKNHHISYKLSAPGNVLDINVTMKQEAKRPDGKIEIVHSWAKADSLSERYNQLEIFLATDKGDGRIFHKRYLAHTKSVRDLLGNVPRGTQLISLAERYFCQVVKAKEPISSAWVLPNDQGLAVVKAIVIPINRQDGYSEFSETIYFGPRDFFYLKNAGVSSAFPSGTIRQIGFILLVVLNGIAKFTRNYGVAIILFSILITAISSPFTLLSFRSMRKMQELKPAFDKIATKYKDDQQKAHQEIIALYKENHVSPLGGCLPMLLQMPVFFAMFQAISHYIELRGKRFLWISDLSLPDRISQFPVALPVLGRDLNLLPVIMAIAMFLQTKMSQKNMAVDSANPSAQLMSGPFMPMLFGVMFYQFPSGLVLYWLTNSLMSLVLYKVSMGDPKKSAT